MGKWRNIQYRLEYGLFLGIAGLVRMLPVETASNLSARVWRKLAPATRRHQRALNNIAQALPHLSAEEREQIIMKMWENLGRVMAETMQLDRILADPKRIQFSGKPVVDALQAEPGPVMLVSLHSGNWEIGVSPLTESGMNPGAVYRLVENPYVEEYIRNIRSRLYPGGLFAKGKALPIGVDAGQKTARKIVSYIRKGGCLGVLCDLYDGKGTEVPFFGKLAKSTTIPAIMARKMGSRILLLRSIRINDTTRFRVEVEELNVPFTNNRDADIKTITTAIQSTFENWIRQYPEQWMWSNRRWS